MFKKAIIFFILMAISVPAFALSDINKHKFEEAIKYLETNEVIDGYPDGTFRPNNYLNRAELMKILIEAKYSKSEIDAINSFDVCFPDLQPGAWYVEYVCLAEDEGIVDGYPDGTFRPGDSVNFVEALKMVLGIYDINYSENYDLWFFDIVRQATLERLIPVDGEDVSDGLKRGSMAELITRAMLMEKKQLEDYLDNDLDINEESKEMLDIDLIAPDDEKYTSLPSSIKFEWDVDLDQAELVLEYRVSKSSSRISKTVRFDADGDSEVIYRSDFEDDWDDYSYFCWRLESDDVDLDVEGGYPCNEYDSDNDEGSTAEPDSSSDDVMENMDTNIATTVETIPTSIRFSWENALNGYLVLEFYDGSMKRKTVRFTADGTSETLSKSEYEDDFVRYGKFCWHLVEGTTRFEDESGSDPCHYYEPEDTGTNPDPDPATPSDLLIDYKTPANGTTVYDISSGVNVTWGPSVSGANLKMAFFQGSMTIGTATVTNVNGTSANIPESKMTSFFSDGIRMCWYLESTDPELNYTRVGNAPCVIFEASPKEISYISPVDTIIDNQASGLYFEWSESVSAVLQVYTYTDTGQPQKQINKQGNYNVDSYRFPVDFTDYQLGISDKLCWQLLESDEPFEIVGRDSALVCLDIN